MAKHLHLPEPVAVNHIADAATEYIAGDVGGETVLTLGLSLHNWRKGEIAAVVNVGPLECMPTRIAESQFFHAAEREGLPTLTLTFNGDPLAEDVLDNFAFEVHARHRAGKPGSSKTVASLGKRRTGVHEDFVTVDVRQPAIRGPGMAVLCHLFRELATKASTSGGLPGLLCQRHC